MSKNIESLTATEIAEGYKNRSLKCEEVIQSCLNKIKAEDKEINSFLDTYEDAAIADAQKWDNAYDSGDDVPALAGVPIALKDNLNDKGTLTRCASKILENYKSGYTATAVQKCRDAGLIPIGKTNMDEFAMGSSTEYSAYGPTRNPWDLDKVPGGSSGGSAAAVAAGFAPLSLGSDTGGSIRQPAAFCGVMGMKPSYGLVSRFGLVAFASSLDQIGPFARSTDDVAAILDTICGYDPRDARSENRPAPNFKDANKQSIKGMKIGVPSALLDVISDEIKEKVMHCLDQLTAEGATWEVMEWGDFDDALSAYYVIAPAEAAANLERYDGVRYGRREKADSLQDMIRQSRNNGFGDEVKRRIMIGTYVLSAGYYDAYYGTAERVRTMVSRQFDESFKKYDLILSPTTPTTAFSIGDNTQDPLTMYYADIATIPVNLAGLPGISVPVGHANGLPVGVQLVAPQFEDARLLTAAASIERAYPEANGIAGGQS